MGMKVEMRRLEFSYRTLPRKVTNSAVRGIPAKVFCRFQVSFSGMSYLPQISSMFPYVYMNSSAG